MLTCTQLAKKDFLGITVVQSALECILDHPVDLCAVAPLTNVTTLPDVNSFLQKVEIFFLLNATNNNNKYFFTKFMTLEITVNS